MILLKDFVKKDQGYILNVGSSAGFMPGPLMATYYSTKNYVVSFSSALYEELKKMGSNVSISCLCPGPVDTEFNKVAGGEFKVDSNGAKKVAKLAIDIIRHKIT